MPKFSNGHLFFLLDVVALISAFLCALLAAPYISGFLKADVIYRISEEFVTEIAYSFSAISAFMLFAFYNKGHYSIRVPWWGQVFYILGAIIVAILVSGFFHFVVKEQLSRALILLSWFFAFFFILIARQFSRFIAIFKNDWIIDCVVIGDRDSAINTFFALASEKYCGYKASALLLRDKDFDSFDREDLPVQYRKIKTLDGRKEYIEYIKSNPDKFYIVELDAFRGEERDKMVNAMSKYNVDYVIVPPMRRVSLYGMEPQYFFGHDVMFLRRVNKLRTPYGRLIKRLMDIIGSVIALLIFSPLFIIISFLIKLDGGNAFYGDMRVSKDGKLFKCWKFRSMYSDAEKRLKELLDKDHKANAEYDRYCKLKNDPRITKIGKFLRKTSLDELPQLFNVLKGDMSMVGPRPLFEHEIKKYGENYGYYKSVRPGITGLWQVSGRSDTSFKQRAHFDAWYVRNWSVWHDIVIIIKTFHVVLFSRSGAY